MDTNLTKGQKRKLGDVPRHLRKMYVESVTGTRRKSAIRFHCLECVAWLPSEVRLCCSTGCILWPYRLGGHPGMVDGNEDAETPGLSGGVLARKSPIRAHEPNDLDPAPAVEGA